MPEMLQGVVLSLTSEGRGVIRHNNFVVFIPFTVPGDHIQYRIVDQKKNFALGELVEIIEPSPNRTVPKCRYYERCGGCQLQHITYPAQLEGKRQVVEDAFRRIGRLKDISVQPVVPAKLHWAYRRHITLKITADRESLQAGYIAVDNSSLVRVEHCPIFIPEDDPSIQELQFLLKNLSAKSFQEGKAILFKKENGNLILSLHFNKGFSFDKEKIESFLKEYHHWSGIVIHIHDKKWILGEVQAIIQIEGMRFVCSPDIFTQNHPEQSLKIYQHITDLISIPHAKVWDLYCGIGISSLLLAKEGHQVVGVEYNEESVKLAQENAQLNGLNTTRFIQGDVEKILERKILKEPPDVMVINPPRAGMTPRVIKEIMKNAPKMIIYISCMPATLARDLNLLCAHRYYVSLVQPYDMFPQTSHVETLVCLKPNLRPMNGSDSNSFH